MKINNFTSTEEWLLARRGKITGSSLKDVYSKAPFTVYDIKAKLDARNAEYKKTATKEILLQELTPEELKELKATAPKKIGFYKLIADKISKPATDESPMDRGNRLEEEAVAELSKATSIEFQAVSNLIWEREDNTNIAISPDAVASNTVAGEIKCLASEKHIQALLTQEIPDEYYPQVLQYFIVNDALETLYFGFYDPRLITKQFHYIVFNREDLQEDIADYLDYQINILREVDEVVTQLTF